MYRVLNFLLKPQNSEGSVAAHKPRRQPRFDDSQQAYGLFLSNKLVGHLQGDEGTYTTTAQIVRPLGLVLPYSSDVMGGHIFNALMRWRLTVHPHRFKSVYRLFGPHEQGQGLETYRAGRSWGNKE